MPVFVGCYPHKAFKGGTKIASAVKSGEICNIFHRHTGLLQQFPALFNTEFRKILIQRHTELFFKHLGKVAGAEIEGLSDIFQPNGLAIMLADIGLDRHFKAVFRVGVVLLQNVSHLLAKLQKQCPDTQEKLAGQDLFRTGTGDGRRSLFWDGALDAPAFHPVNQPDNCHPHLLGLEFRAVQGLKQLLSPLPDLLLIAPSNGGQQAAVMLDRKSVV